MNSVEKRIKNLLELNNMTQSELAQRLGTTQANISRYLSGTRKIDIDILDKIANIFSVSTDYLLGRTVNTDQSELKIALNSVSTDGLDEDDIEMIREIIEKLKKKNQK